MSNEVNFQINTWAGMFGKEYTDRNTYVVEDLDNVYKGQFGVTRTDLNKSFLSGLNQAEVKILEVGCNVGNQLRMLQHMGFKHLFGIELQHYAVEKSKELCKGINIIQGTADNIPFKDDYFDMVFTSNVLIHFSPEDIGAVLDEMYRCTREYIWGFEYYNDTYTEVNYRGHDSLMWKTNFAGLFLERFPDLELVKEEKVKHLSNDNVDQMYLLRKKK